MSSPQNAFYAQSGGVTAVINVSAAAVIETARQHPDKIGKVYAGRDGIIGALTEDLIDTSKEPAAAIRALRWTPGGAFGSCRYKLKSPEEHRAQYERLLEVFEAHDIGYFFYNGGNDSADTSYKVSQFARQRGYPLACIGVPKTVDNDLAVTDCCPGFGSVAKYVATSIREAGRHMDQVVAELQTAAKQPDRAAPAREVVEIAGVVAKAKAMIALAARDAEVDLSRVGPMVGGKVLGDARACTQILLNLFSNAVKFTPAGGSIGLETVVGPDNTLQIVVWDSGLGIAPEQQKRIFDPDYSTEPVRPLGGLLSQGLGLSISRDLARAMGGDLSVISQPGQGSRFILSLPLASPTPAAG